MMKKTGMVVSGLGVPTGAAAMVLYILNLAIWSALTAMLGGALALIGLGLVMWALYPIRGRADEQSETRETAEPAPDMMQAEAA